MIGTRVPGYPGTGLHCTVARPESARGRSAFRMSCSSARTECRVLVSEGARTGARSVSKIVGEMGTYSIFVHLA